MRMNRKERLLALKKPKRARPTMIGIGSQSNPDA
jgi:hypothetical protein